MRTATLSRLSTGDDGTFGELETDDGFKCFTVELPWKDNLADRSCVPAGVYSCNWRYSPKHECNLYHVDNVPGRSSVEIHPANWGGDKTQGKRSDLLGCIGVGEKIELINGQLGVSHSKATLSALELVLHQEPFELTIHGIGTRS